MLNGQMEDKELHQATRAGNLTATDRVVLVDLVQKHWATVESKRTDAVTVKEKMRAWQQIATEFNAMSAAKRSAQQVKQVMVDSNRYNGLLKCMKTHLSK